MMQPLASAGASQSQANNNLSRTISLSVIDQNGNDVPIRTSIDHSIEFIIPRDTNMIVSPMFLQNVTSINDKYNQIFNLYFVNITQSNSDLTVSLHFEMHPLNTSLGYLLIYRFDNSPQLNSSINQIDEWSLFCPLSKFLILFKQRFENLFKLDLTNDNIYTSFIDNQRTSGHRSVIFGIRELNATEIDDFCSNYSFINSPPISNELYNFTSNYELRTYASGCYYLDSNNNWQSDGLLVSFHWKNSCNVSLFI